MTEDVRSDENVRVSSHEMLKMQIDEKFRRLFPKTKPSKLLTRAFGMRDAASSGSWKFEMRRIVCDLEL